MPVPGGVHVAARGGEGTGSQHAGTVSDRTVPWGTGGAILSAGAARKAMGETDCGTVLVDGTKLESCAERYTFVWHKRVEKQVSRVEEQVHKATGVTSPTTLRTHLEELAVGIDFVHGSGSGKSLEQKYWERLSVLLERWEGCETQLSTMGKGRNSYARTDENATFVRMKEAHMRNGQLEPGYNVYAVNSSAGNVGKYGTASLSAPPGIGVSVVPVVPAAASAAGPKNCVSKRLFGTSTRKPPGALPLPGGFICAFAAPSRWRVPLPC